MNRRGLHFVLAWNWNHDCVFQLVGLNGLTHQRSGMDYVNVDVEWTPLQQQRGAALPSSIFTFSAPCAYPLVPPNSSFLINPPLVLLMLLPSLWVISPPPLPPSLSRSLSHPRQCFLPVAEKGRAHTHRRQVMAASPLFLISSEVWCSSICCLILSCHMHHVELRCYRGRQEPGFMHFSDAYSFVWKMTEKHIKVSRVCVWVCVLGVTVLHDCVFASWLSNSNLCTDVSELQSTLVGSNSCTLLLLML